MELVGHEGKYAHSQVQTSPEHFIPIGKRAHFQVQTIPKVCKTRFYQFLYVIVHEFFAIRDSGLFLAEIFHGNSLKPYPWIFGDSGFRLVFGRKFSWISVKALVMEPVGLKRQTGSFSSSNEPQSMSVKTLASWSPGANNSFSSSNNPQ
ncbi:hypothetical protein H5410_035147, partial [Solanum commersonii]